VCLIGLNLAPAAEDRFTEQAGVALFTLAATCPPASWSRRRPSATGNTERANTSAAGG
jgi:hypothetical protein